MKQSQQTYFLAFAARVRSGIFGNAIQVGHQSVEKAIRHVAQTLPFGWVRRPTKKLWI
jgi:hypothetical protein